MDDPTLQLVRLLREDRLREAQERRAARAAADHRRAERLEARAGRLHERAERRAPVRPSAVPATTW